MANLTEYFKRIIDKQREMGYYFPKILNAPAGLFKIRETEKILGLNFNPELRELYSFADGTDNKGLAIGMTGLIPIHQFMSLKDAVSYFKVSMDSNENIIRRYGSDLFRNEEQGFTPGKKLFPFLHDGAGNCYWVDLNEGTDDYGKIFWTNSFGEDPDYAFNSLTIMFQTICECYETGVMYLDKDNHLDCDDDSWNERAHKLNPDLIYWKKYLD
jgi:cell wall assembly regulator SMI1